jgi:transposase
MSPHFVKPYVKSNKNDANDAEAICEAVGRPSMRFVPNKSAEQQGGGRCVRMVLTLAGAVCHAATSNAVRPADGFLRARRRFARLSASRADHLRAMLQAQAIVGQFLQSFEDCPPRAKSASFSLDQVLQKMQEGGRGSSN